MTIYLDTREVEAYLDRALEAAAQKGAEVFLSREGTPLARLVPLMAPEAKPPRVPGIDAGRLLIPDDILQPLPEEITEIYSR